MPINAADTAWVSYFHRDGDVMTPGVAFSTAAWAPPKIIYLR